MEAIQKELAELAIKKIVASLRQILYRIETGQAKDVIGLLEPYMDLESYENVREQYYKFKEEKQKNKIEREEDDDIFEDEEEEEEEGEEASIEQNREDNQENENIEEESFDDGIVKRCRMLYNKNKISEKYLLQIQNVASRLVSNASSASTNSNSGGMNSNMTKVSDRVSRDSDSNGGSNGVNRKKRRGASKGFPLNWNLIMAMVSNISLEQVQSMINVLIMVLSRTPVSVLFKQFHEYKFIISAIYDLLNAIVRRDVKDIGTCLIIAVIGVIRFSQRKNMPLNTALEVAKYLYNTGNKKKFSLMRSVSLAAFLSNLFKLINPPRVTPLDIVSLVKSQIQSRL
ncbi:hypothetical protein DICPUDRAFT_97489 [Dictyostelium purpureum]|uniref:Uncharacterized protein n=1 Tax=Dictyostelium purpureum TaxID=5786 RepID=F0ZH30_DICPU|nr:uncharacterized protein DICPUDRAFT_97489 [Dictyostelium purpureum]EGC36761.1 hypothetical protein DICPUDRAFT_97489 [Dictyostelium purpureum]|eukprot:XP_003286707.1 hypothetical protein DICPUDRAFT_97489 [Dictyostelium purpureum]